MISPVILSGGKGSRLWPLSSEAVPKAYVALPGMNETPLQATLRRLEFLEPHHCPMIVCNEEHLLLALNQASGAATGTPQVVLEPEGRNTAAAVCVAALIVNNMEREDEPMLVLPADHVIQDVAAFAEAVGAGANLARRGYLVTFAVKPSFPATSYGYIKLGPPVDQSGSQFEVAAFIEKPDKDTAAGFLARGGYAWNSGMFMFRPSVVLEAFERYEPNVLRACRAAAGDPLDSTVVKLDRVAFLPAPSTSIDCAIMEKATNVAAVAAKFDWSDVGDWQSVWSTSSHDINCNAVSGKAAVMNCSGSLVHSAGPSLLGVGLKDIIAVATEDAIIVMPRDHSQDIKAAVENMQAASRPEASGIQALRPWGFFRQLNVGAGYKMKELTVLPGAKLSLQRHKFRSEHWICIAGEGVATRGDERIPLALGTSVFISQGAVHRLENTGSENLRIVEIQIGSYTGDDDIERLEDDYGRI